MSEIPEVAFTEILREIKRKPLTVKKKSGSNAVRSHIFGIVGKRALEPDYSRLCWLRPALYNHLLTFGEKYVDISFNAIVLNVVETPEAPALITSKHTVGPSFHTTFGKGQGETYSLVYHWFQTKKSVPVPRPSVRFEEGQYWFYRGPVKITKKTGLPHPLKQKAKKVFEFVREEKEVNLSFD